jgi:hypothetical protein
MTVMCTSCKGFQNWAAWKTEEYIKWEKAITYAYEYRDTVIILHCRRDSVGCLVYDSE